MKAENAPSVFRLAVSLTTILFLASCYKEEAIDLEANFDVFVVNDDFSVPVEISIENNSRGADRYLWTFSGGIPENSVLKQPENVWYRKAGSYQIKLACWYKDRFEVKEMTLELDSAIQIAFEPRILINAFAPASVEISNQSSGSSSYKWTFEGGQPETSQEKQPPLVVYENPGEYTIRLEIGNGREKKELAHTLSILPRMEVDFSNVFSFEDYDRQVPAVVLLESVATSTLQYKWEVPGGIIANDTARHTSVYFDAPGVYTITLLADNGKETQQVQKSVELFPNTNLLTLENVRLGINSSKTDGAFFSGYLRKSLLETEIEENETLGEWIDFVFFGLNNRFSYCRFLSPDSAGIFTFRRIPEARKTSIVNDIEKAALTFSISDFDSTHDDVPLRTLDIKSKDTSNLYFDLSRLPRLILFETEDGRKGAVKINKKVDAGTNSYIEVDIKMQKEPV